jgi:hypothetical protein
VFHDRHDLRQLVHSLAGGDYNFIRFGYQAMPGLGPNTANFSLACELAVGQTA